MNNQTKILDEATLPEFLDRVMSYGDIKFSIFLGPVSPFNEGDDSIEDQCADEHGNLSGCYDIAVSSGANLKAILSVEYTPVDYSDLLKLIVSKTDAYTNDAGQYVITSRTAKLTHDLIANLLTEYWDGIDAEGLTDADYDSFELSDKVLGAPDIGPMLHLNVSRSKGDWDAYAQYQDL